MAEFTVPDGIRPAVLDAFLGELIGNGNLDRALRLADTDDGLELRRFARQCGYPSRQPMRDARTALRELHPEVAAGSTPVVPAATPTLSDAKNAHPSFQVFEKPQPGDGDTEASGSSVVGAAPAAVPMPHRRAVDPVPHAAILLEAVGSVARAAAESGSKSLALMGERFVKAHDALVAGLRSNAEEAAKAQRITELQAELARLRGKTTAAAASAAAPDGQAKQIRTWAAEQGIDCPKVGRVPARVQDAYDAAHQAADA